MKPLKLLHEEFSDLRQGRALEQIYNHGGRIVRIKVYRDSYDFQSYARAELFDDGTAWNRVACVPYSLMASSGIRGGPANSKVTVSSGLHDARDKALKADADAVLAKALLVLEPQTTAVSVRQGVVDAIGAGIDALESQAYDYEQEYKNGSPGAADALRACDEAANELRRFLDEHGLKTTADMAVSDGARGASTNREAST